MTILRRFCALGVSGLIVGGLLTGVAVSAASTVPAAADTPEAFAGSASAASLNLNVLNAIKLAAAATHATADSSPKVHADGAALTGLISAGITGVDEAGPNLSDVPSGENCAVAGAIPAVLSLSLACSESADSTTNGSPTASSTAHVGLVGVQLLGPLLQALQPILNALTPLLNQIIAPVLTTLQQLLGPLLNPLLNGLGIKTDQPVSSLITALENLTTLLAVRVLPSTSVVSTTAGAVTAAASSKGAEIDLLPNLPTGGSLLTIVVGSASTTATFDRTSGKSSAVFNPAIAIVTLLGQPPIKIGGGSSTLLGGTPLESTISLGDGSTSKNPDGSVGAVADGVSLDLLRGIGGGILVQVAHAESGAAGAQAVIAAPTTTSTTVAATTTTLPTITGTVAVKLATTGSSAPVLPIGMVLILAGFLTRRTLRTRRADRTPR